MVRKRQQRGLGALLADSALADRLGESARTTSVQRQVEEAFAGSVLSQGAKDAIEGGLEIWKTISMPADCLEANGELPRVGIAYPAATNRLPPNRLGVIVYPLNRKLTEPEQTTLDAFLRRTLSPTASQYPVDVLTKCSLGARSDDACKCRDRADPARYKPHTKAALQNEEAWSVQACMGDRKHKARQWISIFHNLVWENLPHGYVEVNGQPMIIVSMTGNPDSVKDIYWSDGSHWSGNVKDGYLPELPIGMLRNFLWSKLRSWAPGATVVSPGTMVDIDSFNHAELAAPLSRAYAVYAQAAANDGRTVYGEDEWVDSLTWRYAAYADGLEPTSGPGVTVNNMYAEVVDEAVLQGAAYARNAAMTIWSVVGSLLALAFTSPGTDRLARAVYSNTRARIETVTTAEMIVEDPQGFVRPFLQEAEAISQATADEETPNEVLQQGYKDLKSIRAKIAKGLERIDQIHSMWSDGSLQAEAQNLEVRAREANLEIENGLAVALERQAAATRATDPELQRRFRCLLYKKAINEQNTWPRRIMSLKTPFFQAVGAYGQVASNYGQARAVLEEALARIDKMLAELGLPWWQRTLGPLPVWAWGAIGGAGVIGAAALKKKRKGGKK